uniref:Dicer-like protein 1 n=1 Tax=Lygus hesperus TaxID=30085 RepID=A0A0A9VXW6_LYGHE
MGNEPYTSPCHGVQQAVKDPEIAQVRKLLNYDEGWDLPFYFTYQTLRGVPVVASLYQDVVGQLLIRNKPYIVRFLTNRDEVTGTAMNAFTEAATTVKSTIRFVVAFCGTEEANHLAPRTWDEKLQKNIPVRCTDSIYGSEALHILMPMNTTILSAKEVVEKRTSMYIRYQESMTDREALVLFSRVLTGERGTHYDSKLHTTEESYCSVISTFTGTTEDDLKTT